MKVKLLFNVLLVSSLIYGIANIVISLWDDEVSVMFTLDNRHSAILKEINITNNVINDAIKQYNNNDIKAKIIIGGTNIDNYVVQATNNEYYLNHSLDKNENKLGSIFMDYRNSFSDRNVIIYGHNSNLLSNAPFHDLEQFMNKGFYEDNNTIKLELENTSIVWQIFSVMVIRKTESRHLKINFNDEEWINHIEWLIGNSIYKTGVKVGVNDTILTLQTCYYEPDDSFLIISAKKYNGG